MKITLPVLAILSLAACGSQDGSKSEQSPIEAVAPSDTNEVIPPPRRKEFIAAWAEACPEAQPAGKALCKSNGIGDPGFTCDFALGEDEYRRHTADLEPVGDSWVLVDPENACSVE